MSVAADAIVGLVAGRLEEEAATAQAVHILGDFRRVAQLRQRNWLRGPYLSPWGARTISPPSPKRWGDPPSYWRWRVNPMPEGLSSREGLLAPKGQDQGR